MRSLCDVSGCRKHAVTNIGVDIRGGLKACVWLCEIHRKQNEAPLRGYTNPKFVPISSVKQDKEARRRWGG